MRTSLINAIYGKLETGQFRAADFTLSNRDTGRGYDFTLRYRYDSRFKLDGHISSDGTTVSGTIAPGQLSNHESFKTEGEYDFLELISVWVKRISEELVAIPLARKIAEQEREIENLVEQWEKLPDEYFTRDEADELSERLARLEEDLKVRLVSRPA